MDNLSNPREPNSMTSEIQSLKNLLPKHLKQLLKSSMKLWLMPRKHSRLGLESPSWVIHYFIDSSQTKIHVRSCCTHPKRHRQTSCNHDRVTWQDHPWLQGRCPKRLGSCWACLWNYSHLHWWYNWKHFKRYWLLLFQSSIGSLCWCCSFQFPCHDPIVDVPTCYHLW